MIHEPDLREVATRLFADYSGPQVPGMSVAVIGREKVLFSGAFGMADIEAGIPVSPETSFRLASLTKQFTAAAILILAEEGKLGLDEALDRILSDLPPWGRHITVRHLLNHTSGVPDYESRIPPGTTLPLLDKDVLCILRDCAQTDFPAGSSFHYSNSGYALLALIIEARSGMTFAEFLERRVFLPLGMRSTVAFEEGISTVQNRAYGYTATRDGFRKTDQSLTSSVLGDGGIYSSVVDLMQWERALRDGLLLSPASWRLAFQPGPESDFPGSRYGFGWYVARYRGAKELWHYGETTGFTTRIRRFPAKRLSCILLANRSQPDLATLSDKLVALYW
jgi:CubicO group peptidase (beta-lactamase class C family)